MLYKISFTISPIIKNVTNKIQHKTNCSKRHLTLVFQSILVNISIVFVTKERKSSIYLFIAILDCFSLVTSLIS